MLKELRLIRNLPAALIFVLILNGACQENEPLYTGISPSTTYYVRAYATNSAGTALGEEVRFTTAADPSIVAPEKKDSSGADPMTGIRTPEARSPIG